ncbi:MAG: hypothetical protein HY749_16190 [Gammaproteobacteria bacterium]|nr:hypothetical protein [Gammaproteobacteria bacterium]
MDMQKVVKARSALGAILSGPNVTEAIESALSAAHDALLAYERTKPTEQAEAFAALAEPRESWEIG